LRKFFKKPYATIPQSDILMQKHFSRATVPTAHFERTLFSHVKVKLG